MDNSQLNPVSPSKSLIFSVALNGYEQAFRRCVESQAAYAHCFGHDYICVSDIGGEINLGMAGAWLKIPLLLGALRRGYRHVVFIDADIEVTSGTPDIVQEILARRKQGIFCALGHSGRINSGVMAVRNTPDALRSLERIFSRAGTYLPEKAAVSWWGENGQVIQELAGNPVFGELGLEWNNTFDPELTTGFRHYTGPMRPLYIFDTDEQAAWDEVRKNRFEKTEQKSYDRPSFFLQISQAYDVISRQIPQFGSLEPSAFRAEILLGGHLTQPRADLTETRSKSPFRLHFCHEMNFETPTTNAYLDQLAGGIGEIVGRQNVYFGVDSFWTGDYSATDALHIQFIEVLCNWKKPNADDIQRIAARLDEIRRTTRIVVTLHNIELKADFGEMAERLLDAVMSRTDVLIHLSGTSVAAFGDRYRSYSWASQLDSRIIRHGSYECYHDVALTEEAPGPRDHVYICGAIRNASEWKLAQGVCANAEAAGLPVVFAGHVASTVLDWKQRRQLEQSSSDLVLRRHSRVSTEHLVAWARSARCFFLPRVGRLNSGVWYLATSFARPSITPDQLSMREDQDLVGGRCYPVGDVAAAFAQIRAIYDQPPDERFVERARLMRFAQTQMAWPLICKQHIAAYCDQPPAGKC